MFVFTHVYFRSCGVGQGRASGAVVTAAEVPIPVEEDQRHEATAQ